MAILQFVFEVDPVPKGRPRLGKYGTYTPERTRNFEKTIQILAITQMRKRNWKSLEGPLSVSILFRFKRPKKPSNPYPRSDLDNNVKGILDSLNQIAYLDDAQICHLECWKQYGDRSGIVLTLSQISEVSPSSPLV